MNEKRMQANSDEEKRVKWREKSKGQENGKITLEKYVGKQSMIRQWKVRVLFFLVWVRRQKIGSDTKALSIYLFF
jgi:hypothetical protein